MNQIRRFARSGLFVFLTGVLAGLHQTPLIAGDGGSAISADDLRTHVRYLASDDLKGRRAGTEGNDEAAEYIAGLLKDYDITPGGDNGTFLQKFEFVADLKLGTGNAVAIVTTAGSRTLTLDQEFRPLALSENGSLDAPLVFVGYGISAPDKNYDDYAGIDVKGKVVVVLRFGPDGDSPRSEFARYTALRNKARTAREKGAAGLVLITAPGTDQSDDLLKLRFDQVAGSSGLPAITAKRSVFEPLLGKTLKEIQDSIAARKGPMSFPVAGASIRMSTDLVKVMATTTNILGYLEGQDPMRKGEVLVLGAHFDHLGMGGEGSGSLTPDSIAVHNGADDNASGTAGLLELAQRLSAERSTLQRTVVFAFFSGEELGTLGSGYYVNHPPFPLSQTVAMMNMDMIGRLTNRSLTVGGSGTSPAWPPLLSKYNADSAFALTLNPDGFGPSDHASFYGKEIPVLFFFTGTHDQYHKPSDDWDRLNYEGEQRIVEYVYSIAREIDSLPARPAYARVETKGSTMGGGDSRGFSVTLGIVPEYAEGTKGTKVGGIRPNGPAEKAGLKSGDLIVGLAGKQILNIYDYMGVLGELKAGDVVEVDVMREGKPMRFTATMEKRK